MKNAREVEEINEIIAALLPPEDGRKDVISILARKGYTGKAAEIGTLAATYSAELLDGLKIATLYCIDPYANYDDFKDALNNLNMDGLFGGAKQALERFGERAQFIREYSDRAAPLFEDGSLDFVYVDGNHQYAFVKKDLEMYWPKIRPGGLLVGDDCIDVNDEARNENGDVTIVHLRNAEGKPQSYGDYGVFNAVREFTGAQALGFIRRGSQVIIPKPNT